MTPVQRLVALATVALLAGAFAVGCGKSKVDAGPGSPTPAVTRSLGPDEAGRTLAEMARAAGREDGYRIQYRQISGRDTGTLTLARLGDRISVRMKATADGKPVEMFAREGGNPPILCLFTDGRWGCVEGDQATASQSAPIFVDRGSFDRFAARVATVPADEFRITGLTVAGRDAVCYDTPPRPEGVTGPNPFVSEEDILADVLREGGSVCFGDGKMLKLSVLSDPPISFEALDVGKASDVDMEPPARPDPALSPNAPATVVPGK